MRLQLESKVKVNDVKTLLIYLLIFNSVWVFKELWLIQYIDPLNEVTSAFLNALIKILVWVVPVWLYIKYFLHANPIKYLKMNSNIKKGLFWGIFLSLLLGLYFAFQVYIVNDQSFNFNLSLSSYLNGILLVGITEEIVFRGLILQEINKRLAFWKANIITALLFLIVHYAIWIYEGVFFDLWSHIYVFLVGLIFGIVYKKTGSFWSVVILHSFHNFFVSIA
ncbi:CPBP family intramembrane glutamic endopeptidase [Bacillus sp. JJ722]|uniref:CPBP family intramembrane glutamic endopeptidase n=1 Tax=Bacillus sp. JJ722 TaxID=3122973 RepID=UPI002FFD9480